MKLATYDDGSRDGQLVVVSRDLGLAHFATGIATRLQQVLDDWNFLSPQLEDLSATLNGGKARHAFAFDPRTCKAPLPRAYRWALVGDGTDAPLHGAGDHFLGPRDEWQLPAGTPAVQAWAGVAVVTGDLPRAAPAERVLEGVRLAMLFCGLRPANQGAVDVPGAGADGPVAFAPVAVTPDELGDAWQGGRVIARPVWHVDGQRQPDAAAGVRSTAFGPALQTLTALGPVRAGSVAGSALAHRVLPAAAPGAADDEFGTLRLAVEGVVADGASPWGAVEPRLRWPRSPRASGSP